MKSKSGNVFFAIGAVLLIVALVGWFFITGGAVAKPEGSTVMWGAENAAFYCAAACGAGTLVLVGASAFGASINRTMQRRLSAAACASFVTAGVLVAADLGSLGHVGSFLVAFKVGSLMTWDCYMLALCLIVSIACYVRTGKSAVGKGTAVLAIACAVVLVVVESLMLAVLPTREMWHSGMTAVSFLAAAAACGSVLWAAFSGQVASRRLSAITLVVFACVLALDGMAAPEMIPLGGFELFAFGLVMCVLAVVLACTKSAQSLMALVALAGVFSLKLWHVVAGQAVNAFSTFSYAPAAAEWAVALGVAGLGLMAYQLLVRPERKADVASRDVQGGR